MYIQCHVDFTMLTFADLAVMKRMEEPCICKLNPKLDLTSRPIASFLYV